MNSFLEKHLAHSSKDAARPKILVPCEKHRVMPNEPICPKCLGEISQYVKALEQIVQAAQLFLPKLHEEGMGYFLALEQISQAECECPSTLHISEREPDGRPRDGRLEVHHGDRCPVGIAARAIQGYEGRPLHRPATEALLKQKLELEAQAETKP